MTEIITPLMPARAVSLPVTTVSQPVETGSLWVTGWSFIETTGAAPATLVLVDGGDANGQPVAFISLLAGQSVRDLIASWPLQFQVGVFAKVTAGSVQGSVWVVDPPINQ